MPACNWPGKLHHLCKNNHDLKPLSKLQRSFSLVGWLLRSNLPHKFFTLEYPQPLLLGRDDQDPARFVPALGALFLKLRADIDISTHHGFSYQEIGYGLSNRSDSKISGLVECVRSLSPKECDSCIDKAIEKLLFYCGGKDGATLVHGLCLVRFDSNKFYHGGVSSSEGGGVTGNFTIFTVGNGEGENNGRVKKLVMKYWISGVACFLGFIALVWLLRRRALNTAKVESSDFGKTADRS